jgi:hypothetical protein
VAFSQQFGGLGLGLGLSASALTRFLRPLKIRASVNPRPSGSIVHRYANMFAVLPSKNPWLALRGYMRKEIVVSLSTAVLAAATWAATGEPWKEKEYKQWTMEEAQKILNDSPWVHTANVDAAWIKGQPQYLSPLPETCTGRPDMNRPMRTPPQWNLGTMTQSVVAYQIAWRSSRTMRAAQFRLRVLCGRAEEEQGDDALEQDPEQYIITVSSPDMSPFDGMPEEALLQNTYLMLKKNKQRVSPEKVVIGHLMDQRTVFRLTFTFPKRTDSGEPLVAPDEKEIEFVAQAGKIAVKTKFQPQKMAAKSGMDL